MLSASPPLLPLVSFSSIYSIVPIAFLKRLQCVPPLSLRLDASRGASLALHGAVSSLRSDGAKPRRMRWPG
jgi:hypothetical protein